MKIRSDCISKNVNLFTIMRKRTVKLVSLEISVVAKPSDITEFNPYMDSKEEKNKGNKSF